MNFDDNFLDDNLGFISDDDIDINFGRPRRPNVLQRYNERFDPLELAGREFYTRFRFSKDSIENHLVPLLYPDGVRAENNKSIYTSITIYLSIYLSTYYI